MQARANKDDILFLWRLITFNSDFRWKFRPALIIWGVPLTFVLVASG